MGGNGKGKGKGKAMGGADSGAAAAEGVDFGFCAICLEKILLQETALVKGCEHAYWFVIALV